MSTVQENFDYKRTVKVNLASEKIRHHVRRRLPEVICRKPFARSLCPPTRNSRASPLVSRHKWEWGNQFLPSYERQSRIERTLCDVAFRHSEREKYLQAGKSLAQPLFGSSRNILPPNKRNVLRDKSKQRLSLLCSNVSVVIVSHTGV